MSSYYYTVSLPTEEGVRAQSAGEKYLEIKEMYERSLEKI
jgi:hypothetical protein